MAQAKERTRCGKPFHANPIVTMEACLNGKSPALH
jgi:hypothetical protein